MGLQFLIFLVYNSFFTDSHILKLCTNISMLFTIETQILNLLLAFQCILVNIFTIIVVLDLHFWPLHLLWHSLGALCIWLYLQLLLIGENPALKKYDKLA